MKIEEDDDDGVLPLFCTYKPNQVLLFYRTGISKEMQKARKTFLKRYYPTTNGCVEDMLILYR